MSIDLSGVHVLWDNDATLVDSEIIAMPHAINSVFAYFASLGLGDNVPTSERDELAIRWAGKQISQMFELAADRFGVTIDPDLLKELCEDDAVRVIEALKEVEVIVGIPEALSEVEQSGGINSVVTSSSLARVLPGLGRNNLTPFFTDGSNLRVWSATETLIPIYGHAIPKSAQHPEIYQYALQATSAQRGQCVAIEDSASGLGAALAAGIPVVGLVAASHIPEDKKDEHKAGLIAKAVEVLGREPSPQELIIVDHPSEIVPAIAQILGREAISQPVPVR